MKMYLQVDGLEQLDNQDHPHTTRVGRNMMIRPPSASKGLQSGVSQNRAYKQKSMPG